MTTEENKIETTVVSFQDAMSGNIPLKAEEAVTQKEPVEDLVEPEQTISSDQPAENPQAIEDPVLPKIKDEEAIAFLKEKGFEIESLDDLKKQPEVKEVNPYEDILDDDDKAYLKFKKETGRSRKDFESLNVDYDKVSSVELAREKVRKNTGLNLTNEQIDEYLSNELDVDLSDELSASDTIKLASYVKSLRDEKKIEQEKFRQPAATTETVPEKTEYVKLDNGSVIKKTDYEKLVNNHQQYISKNKESVNSVTETVFSIKVDDNGTERELTYNYEFSESDKHSMVSITSDTTAYVNKAYRTEEGFNHKQFNEDMFWANPKNREKVIGNLLQKARAEAVEEVMKERGNVNLSPQNGLHKQKTEGVKVLPVSDWIAGAK